MGLLQTSIMAVSDIVAFHAARHGNDGRARAEGDASMDDVAEGPTTSTQMTYISIRFACCGYIHPVLINKR